MKITRAFAVAVAVAVAWAAALRAAVGAPAAVARPATAPAATSPAKPFISWFNPPKAPDPLRVHRGYDSAAMRTRVGYMLYLPPGYADPANAARRYPVLYWLHGYGGNESGGGFPAKVVDAAVRAGTVPPLIVVYANGGANSWYADSSDGKWLAATTFLNELIPHVDATYRTVPTRGGRAIQGMSMGGSGAMKFALGHPELFSSVVSFAGSYRTADELGDDPDKGVIFRTMYGGDAARFAADHAAGVLARNADAVRGKLAIKFFIGTADRQMLIDGNRRLDAQMAALQVPHEYGEINGIDHNLAKLAAAVKTEALEFAARHFDPAVVPPTARPAAAPAARGDR